MEMQSVMENTKIENPSAQPDTSKLASLAQQAASETSTSGFMQAGTKVKNKGGRPPKPRDANGKIIKEMKPPRTGPPPQNGNTVSTGPQDSAASSQSTTPSATAIPSKKIAEPGVKLLSKLGAAWAGDPRAQMQPDELDSISEACGLVLDKWMPTVAGAYGAELYLMVALSQWGTRLYAIRQVIAMEQQEAIKRQQQTNAQVKRDRTNLNVVVTPETESVESSGAYFDLKEHAENFGPVPQ